MLIQHGPIASVRGGKNKAYSCTAAAPAAAAVNAGAAGPAGRGPPAGLIRFSDLMVTDWTGLGLNFSAQVEMQPEK